MKLVDLKAHESSLELVHPTEWSKQIKGIAGTDESRSSFIQFAKNEKILSKLLDLNPSDDQGLVASIELWESISANSDLLKKCHEHFAFVATCQNIALAMCRLSLPFYEQYKASLNDVVDGRQMGTAEIHPNTVIAQHVFIGKDVVIEENVEIHTGVVIMSGSRVGAGTVLYPNATLYPHTTIGKNCRIHSGVKIGCDGFGYNFDAGVHHKIWHLGAVKIGDNVEIGANSTIDRGTFGDTCIGDGCKIDNLVQIAHNCQIGKGVILCAQSGVAGSTIIGDYCVFAGQSGAADQIELGQGVQVGAGAKVIGSWPAGTVLGGNPARPIKEWMRGVAYVRKQSLKK